MPWIKRNLIFVISGAVGVILLGLAGFFLYSEMGEDQTSAAALSDEQNLRNQVSQADPSPTDENIELAKKDAARAEALIVRAKSQFSAFKKYAPASDREYKDYIEKCVGDMQRAAANAGVGLSDPDYYFSFAVQSAWLKLPTEITPLWIEQMEEVQTLVGILIRAHVNTIEGLRRVQLDPRESGGADCFSGLNSTTNRGVVRTPYEVTFRSFSSELAGVLDGFMHASNCFLIKNVYVTQSGASSESFLGPNDNPSQTVIAPVEVKQTAPTPAMVNPNASTEMTAAQMQDAMAKRYRIGRYSRPAQEEKTLARAVPDANANLPKAGQVQAPPIQVLGEKPLRVSIFLELLKLDPAAAK